MVSSSTIYQQSILLVICTRMFSWNNHGAFQIHYILTLSTGELGFSSAMTLWCDNISTIYTTTNHVLHTFDINEGSDITQNVATTLYLLKKQLNSDRSNYIKKKMEENKQKLYIANLHVYNLTKSRRNISDNNSDVNSDLLAMRQYEVLCIGNSFDLPEGDNNNYQEEGSYASSTELIGNNLGGRNEIRPIKLPIVQKLPKYTTWIFLDRNQKMAEDQLVVGRRRINYDQIGGQALINSDNEDDVIDDEEDKKRFTSADDYIIRMTIQQEGLTDVVLNSLSQCLEKNSDEIMVRYEILQERDKDEEHVNDEMKAKTKIEDEFLDKDLGTALDSFDSLFCRRCLVFDCRLHGCSQDLVLPVEKQHPWNNNSDDGIPCGVHCYKLAPQPYLCTGENSYKLANNDGISWKAIEQSLFAKGLEIFDRNSCLISRNLLNGLKTCKEVFHRMNSSQSNGPYKVDGTSYLVEGDNDFNGIMGTKLHTKSKSLRRRGRVRRLKYTWKSAGYHSIRKRISDKKDEPCRQYNPCGCQYACGKQCPCLLNGTCCEKYCGCPKICKNRFRGCHCAKSQCRSRQCPCFATNRECDPDVCRNCWISCGDGTLGAPNQRGDNSDCQNMKLLLKQQQRVLLGRSDVAGWGAFIKNTVSKHEYLGEYTGELITHQEADIRDSSFLFNLNDQLVIDAHRKGNKLKFANHSPRPNCYAKVTMVAGDHKVGIFAKERIIAGEELFYDYRYEPDEAPAWARKPESSGSKKGDSRPSISRAKKLA